MTDVVWFNDYPEMYSYLYETWRESLEVMDDELDFYENIPRINVSATDIEANWEYFFWGKNLFDNKSGEIKNPYFFVKRNISLDVLHSFDKNKVHLIYGGRLSGKTYCLIELFQMVKDRPAYFFDGRSRLSQHSLEILMNKTKIAVFFDVGALSKEQFELVLQNAKRINMNENNFVICLNNNDSDTLGVIKWRLRQGYIENSDIISYEIVNKFSNEKQRQEILDVDSKYPILNLPPYENKNTFLDQIIYAEDTLNVKSKYSKNHIAIGNKKQLALMILLAIKERLYSLEIEKYGLDVEIIEVLKKYSPLIERVEVNVAEKDNSDLSSIKYILNSGYWLRRELGNYAREGNNKEIVADAYYYIIERVQDYTNGNEYIQRENCRDLVRFDIMNDIFLNKFKGSISLVVCIYAKLHPLLATDFNFLHQNAKCYLYYAFYTRDKDKKKKYLIKANRLAIIAHEMVERKNDTSYNEKLNISLAHIKFTKAIILSELCRQNEYNEIDDIEIVIGAILDAWKSPYNDKERQKNKNEKYNKGISKFIEDLAYKVDMDRLSKESRKQYEELLKMYMNK